MSITAHVTDHDSPRGDAWLAGHYKKRMIAAQEAVLQILREAEKDGFVISVNTGKNGPPPTGEYAILAMQIYKQY